MSGIYSSLYHALNAASLRVIFTNLSVCRSLPKSEDLLFSVDSVRFMLGVQSAFSRLRSTHTCCNQSLPTNGRKQMHGGGGGERQKQCVACDLSTSEDKFSVENPQLNADYRLASQTNLSDVCCLEKYEFFFVGRCKYSQIEEQRWSA